MSPRLASLTARALGSTREPGKHAGPSEAARSLRAICAARVLPGRRHALPAAPGRLGERERRPLELASRHLHRVRVAGQRLGPCAWRRAAPYDATRCGCALESDGGPVDSAGPHEQRLVWEVRPRAGTVVAFDASLHHEVCPTFNAERFALTLWVWCEDHEGAGEDLFAVS